MPAFTPRRIRTKTLFANVFICSCRVRPGPKQGVGIFHHSSLYEQILGWVRTHSKEEGSMQTALLMIQRDCVDI